MTEGKRLYRVVSDLWFLRLPDPLEHGYESEQDFRRAVRQLVRRWKGRVGECIDERHDFRFLRFDDTPGGRPDEEWLPVYLLEEVGTADPTPEAGTDTSDEASEELNDAFGFD